MCAIKYIIALKKKHYPLYAAITISFAIIVCIVNLGMTSTNQISSNSDLISSKSSSTSVTKKQTTKHLKKNSENLDTDSKKPTSSTVNKKSAKTVKADTDTDLNKQKTTKNDSKKTMKSSNGDKSVSKKNSKAIDTSFLSTTPKSYKIYGVVHYNQNPEMPTGCEIVSAKTALSYYGVELTYDDMLKHIQRADLKMTKKGKLYGKTPFQAFVGNPKKTNGFGCYPPVIMNMIEDYGFEKFYAESTCNLPLDFIAETYVTQDIPVLVWASIGMMKTGLTNSWYVEDDNGKPTKEKYTWRVNEHCLVLIGYDEKYYYFSDPLSNQKETKYERALVEKRYEEVGKNSLIIRERE